MAVLDRYLSYGVWLLNDEQMAAHQMRLDREKRVSWARFLTSSSLIAAATISFVHSFTRSHLHDLRTSNSCRVKFSGNIARHRFPLFGISNSLSFFFIITLHYFQIFDWSYRKCVCDICNVPCAKCATFTIFQLISSTSSVADWSTLIPLRIVTSIEKQRKETMRERLIFFVSVHWIGFLPCGFF